MDAIEALLSRRSIRRFTDEPLDETQIAALLRAGMYAPSAHNTRTWEFVTVTDKQKLQELAALCKYWGPLKHAPLCIACCSQNPEDLHEDVFSMQNGVAAVENILLAAHAMGLGGVWLNSVPNRPYYEPSKASLGIPGEVLLVALLAVGHPADEQPPRALPEDRFEPQKWHKEYY